MARPMPEEAPVTTAHGRGSQPGERAATTGSSKESSIVGEAGVAVGDLRADVPIWQSPADRQKMLFLAALALRPSPEEPRSSLQPPRMPTLTHATIAAVETNHTALPVEGGGGMADVLTSVSKNFRPEEAFKSAAEAVQKLPAATKDKVKADVQSIVASLPPELASYMQARAEKLTRVLPEEVRGALRADPSASIGRADELLNKLNETEQAEASTAVQEMLLGAVQFAMSQPQQAMTMMNGFVSALPPEFSAIVQHLQQQLTTQATDALNTLPPNALATLQRSATALMPLLGAAGGGAPQQPWGAYPVPPQYAQQPYAQWQPNTPPSYMMGGMGGPPGGMQMPGAMGMPGAMAGGMPGGMGQMPNMQQNPMQDMAYMQAMQRYMSEYNQAMQAHQNMQMMGMQQGAQGHPAGAMPPMAAKQ